MEADHVPLKVTGSAQAVLLNALLSLGLLAYYAVGVADASVVQSLLCGLVTLHV